MVYAKIENNEVVKVGRVKELLPHVSSPENLSASKLKTFGVYKIENNRPTLETWQSSEKLPLELKNGKVTQEYSVNELSVDEFRNKKISSSEKQCHDYVTGHYPYYRQLTAMAESDTEVVNWCMKKVNDFRAWRTHMLTLTTHDEIDACDWRTIELDENLNIVSETFWEA